MNVPIVIVIIGLYDGHVSLEIQTYDSSSRLCLEFRGRGEFYDLYCFNLKVKRVLSRVVYAIS